MSVFSPQCGVCCGSLSRRTCRLSLVSLPPRHHLMRREAPCPAVLKTRRGITLPLSLACAHFLFYFCVFLRERATKKRIGRCGETSVLAKLLTRMLALSFPFSFYPPPLPPLPPRLSFYSCVVFSVLLFFFSRGHRKLCCLSVLCRAHLLGFPHTMCFCLGCLVSLYLPHLSRWVFDHFAPLPLPPPLPIHPLFHRWGRTRELVG